MKNHFRSGIAAKKGLLSTICPGVAKKETTLSTFIERTGTERMRGRETLHQTIREKGLSSWKLGGGKAS